MFLFILSVILPAIRACSEFCTPARDKCIVCPNTCTIEDTLPLVSENGTLYISPVTSIHCSAPTVQTTVSSAPLNYSDVFLYTPKHVAYIPANNITVTSLFDSISVLIQTNESFVPFVVLANTLTLNFLSCGPYTCFSIPKSTVVSESMYLASNTTSAGIYIDADSVRQLSVATYGSIAPQILVSATIALENRILIGITPDIVLFYRGTMPVQTAGGISSLIDITSLGAAFSGAPTQATRHSACAGPIRAAVVMAGCLAILLVIYILEKETHHKHPAYAKAQTISQPAK